MSGILSTAISGLQASQNALRTAGHNISNANTAGFSRQEVHFDTRNEHRIGDAGFIGTGVNTRSIERIVDEFVTTQLRLDTSTFHQLDKYNTNIGKVDKLFADVSTGLAGGLQSFFAALQNGADDPSSTPARQLIVTQAESLSTRFNNLHDRLVSVEAGINREIEAVTGQIGSLASSIAALNQAIAEKSASGTGNMPNDLLDQRDEALRKLSELTSIQVVKQDGTDLDVFIGNGQPLVVGQMVSKFSVRDGGQIFLANNIHSANVSKQITGGQIGGLLTFREEILSTSMNELGRLAIVMSDEFNKLQQQGLDLDGDYGQLMFRDINDPGLIYDRVLHGKNSPPDNRVISLTIDDASQLTASDYRFEIIPNTSNYVVTRMGDNKIVTQGLLNGAYPAEISFDGVTVNLESGSFQGGDSFTLQPTRKGASGIAAEITRPEDLAFALPIRAGSNSGNIGNGLISAGEVIGMVDVNGELLPAFATPGQLSPPIVIRFTSATTYDVLDNTDPANPVHLNPPMREQIFVPGRDNLIFSGDVGETRIAGEHVVFPLAGGLYPAELFTFSITDPATGLISNRTLTSSSSAAQTAAMLNGIPGVSANAFTTANISNVDLNGETFGFPVQITINGEPLLQYPSGAVVGDAPLGDVPDPGVDKEAFNNYLAQQINSNSNFQALGMRAVSGADGAGNPELRLVASSGVNIQIGLAGSIGSGINLTVNDGSTSAPPLIANDPAMSIGGRVDLTLAEGITLTTPATSQIFGDSSAANFAQSSFPGYQVSIKGQPQAGDTFTLDFNSNATNDNRNALRFVSMETKASVADDTLSFGNAYGRLVEVVGTKSNLASINTAASKSLLEQTQTMRDGISGVNLDEEAANLIKFEQMYNANARVISVARDLFDSLLAAL